VQPKLAGSPYSGFLSKFDSTGSTLLFSTYYGLLSHISPPRVDAQGNIWLSGATTDAGSLVLAPNSVVLGNSLIAEIAPDASRVLFSALLPNGVTSQDLQVNPDSTIPAADSKRCCRKFRVVGASRRGRFRRRGFGREWRDRHSCAWGVFEHLRNGAYPRPSRTLQTIRSIYWHPMKSRDARQRR